MNNYTNLLYRLTGQRIRKYRKKAKLNQTGFRIERATLSNIENGKVSARNPHYMNCGHISDIVSSLHEHSINVSPSELVWGNESEKTAYIKLIVLSILFNHTNQNPFRFMPLSSLSATGQEECDYFMSPSNHALYELLQVHHDDSYLRISNLILKQLLLCEGLSSCFNAYLKSYSGYDPKQYKDIVISYLQNKSTFISDFLLNEHNYPHFVVAFGQFWSRAKTDYLSFFEANLFCGDNVLMEKGMKSITSDKIHNILNSAEFSELNEWLLTIAENVDMATATTNMIQRLTMVAMINRDDPDMFCDDAEIGESTSQEPSDIYNIIMQKQSPS